MDNLTKFLKSFKEIVRNFKKFSNFCEHVEHFEWIRNVVVFWKIIKVWNLFKNKNIIRIFQKIIKTIPKKFNEILQKFIKVYNS